jgi:predicted glycosyltransferase involved in capsule biosynthesis
LFTLTKTFGKMISFYTTCKGRLNHLKRTLPFNLSECSGFDTEFIILDYCCPDGTGKWIKDNFINEIKGGKIIYCRYDIESDFHISHAKNLGASLCNKNIICSVDADCFIDKTLVQNLITEFTDNNVFCSACGNKDSLDSWGFTACKKKDFLAIGGYNEDFSGYGQDDVDFVERLERLGLKKILLNKIKNIKHDNRTEFYNEKDIKVSMYRNEMISKGSALVANSNKVWGKARIRRNFIEDVLTGNGMAIKRILLC